MIRIPVPCSSCGCIGITPGDEYGVYARCDTCNVPQPKPPGPPCAWCDAESCGTSLGIPFCTNHAEQGMRAFAQGIVTGRVAIGRASPTCKVECVVLGMTTEADNDG